MDPVSFTRELIDIESTTGNEGAIGKHLLRQLSSFGFQAEQMPLLDPGVETDQGYGAIADPDRFNVYANCPESATPRVVFSTHMDTVPPFIPSSEDREYIYGRGACDAKGILASQVAAAIRLRQQGIYVGMLFVVAEERNSTGAIAANRQPRGSRYLVNGEPTQNKLGIASKGSMRVNLAARGRMAHSAYPDLGESAIDKLLEALQRLRAMRLPENPEVGPATMNIGVIEGGRAPNVVPDMARAQLLYRLVGPSDELRRGILHAVEGLADVEFGLEIPYVKLRTVPGIPTMVAAFTTDIPALSNWGEPLLIGPGSIHVAHTERECVAKADLAEAVDLYCAIAQRLSKSL